MRKPRKRSCAEEIVRSHVRRIIEGGEGSGYFDHPGRPGEVGGSAPEGGGGGSKGTSSTAKSTRGGQRPEFDELDAVVSKAKARSSTAGKVLKKGSKGKSMTIDQMKKYIADLEKEIKATNAETKAINVRARKALKAYD